jgi:hypothetical protein
MPEITEKNGLLDKYDYSLKQGMNPDSARDMTASAMDKAFNRHAHDVAPGLDALEAVNEREVWQEIQKLIMEGDFNAADRETLLEKLGPEPLEDFVTLPSPEGEEIAIEDEDPSLYERHMHLYADVEKDTEEYERSLMSPWPEPVDTSNDIPGEPGYGTGGECYRNEAGQLDRDPKEGPARIVSFDEGFDDYQHSETTSYYVQAGELVAVCKENYIGDCEGYNETVEWLNADGKRHREDGPAYEYTSVHNIPEETYLDRATVQFWEDGVLIESQDRTYEDIISNKPLSVRQAFGYDIDDPREEDISIVDKSLWFTGEEGSEYRIVIGQSSDGYRWAVDDGPRLDGGDLLGISWSSETFDTMEDALGTGIKVQREFHEQGMDVGFGR